MSKNMDFLENEARERFGETAAQVARAAAIATMKLCLIACGKVKGGTARDAFESIVQTFPDEALDALEDLWKPGPKASA